MSPPQREESTRMRIRQLKLVPLLSLAAIGSLTGPAMAARLTVPEGKVSAGFLTCHVAAGFGFIFGSTREVNCTYSPEPGKTEDYTGHIDKFGADIGYLSSAVMIWGVYAQSTHEGPGALAGDYVGATAGAAVGIGGGMNVMVGGSGKTIALQPLSIEGNQGLNVAAGVVRLRLDYQKE